VALTCGGFSRQFPAAATASIRIEPAYLPEYNFT